MNLEILFGNLLNPVVLFFFVGFVAVLIKSDLEIPQPFPKFFSIYLLTAIGFKGGVELSKNGLNVEVVMTLLAAGLMAFIVPIYSFFILRIKMDVKNAAAIAATFGSVSAVTFITATSFLDNLQIGYGGHMVAAMALMESPAIVVGILLNRVFQSKENSEEKITYRQMAHEALCNGPVVLLFGSLIVGLLTGEQGHKALYPFTDGIFKGMLALFLLDMGILAAGRIKDLKRSGWFLVAFAIFIPLLNAFLSLFIAKFLGLSLGNAFLFSVLCASASYIAVPAAMRLAIPEANPSFYVSMSLGVTFPFNIVVGLPVYFNVVQKFWGPL
ncbi:MAG: sodium-dependent bicarbonate transport family permease [Elusimicrobiota bacterium]